MEAMQEETLSEASFKIGRFDRRAALIQAINKAAGILPLVWPMQTFIASNPLRDLEDKPFLEAIDEALALYHHPSLQSEATQTVNRLLMKWSQLFFDQEQAALQCFDARDSFYSAWRQNQPYDSELRGIEAPPKDPLFAIDQVIASLSIPEEEWESFFKLQFAALPGWGGWIKRIEQWEKDSSKATLAQFLAVRLILFAHFDGTFPQLQFFSSSKNFKEDIEAAEEKFHQDILGCIKSSTPGPAKETEAQWIFCIDTRSEPLRRHLEQTAAYTTFGYAGFFGIPLALKSRHKQSAHPACPIILNPQHTVVEKRSDKTTSQLSKKEKRIQLGSHLFRVFKKNLWTPFALVEALGIFSGLSSLLSTLFPLKVRSLQKKLTYQHNSCFVHSDDEISLEKAVSYAKSFLTSIGLVNNFASFVVLCGHGSDTNNNLHASALQCGACGGNEGGANAQVMVGILNDPRVRSQLKEKGLVIPEKTRFIAALHETTTDSIDFFDSVPAKLAYNTEKATKKTQEEKKQHFNLKAHGAKLSSQIAKKGASWSETRPEWGLARNAGFIVAPRATTRGLNMEGRCFLHSYDYLLDPDGTILQGILGGPVTVAHWINMQYLFSTLHPALFGGGNKVTHNITGRFGLMQGNGSDLMHGLPLQSLYSDDKTPHHYPARLHLLVEAPERYVEQALAACPTVKQAIENKWLHLTILPRAECS